MTAQNTQYVLLFFIEFLINLVGLNEVESAFILFGYRRIFNESGFEMTFSASSVTFVDKSVKRSDCKQTVDF
ncbi:hypothetical protein OAE37_01880 [Pirellulaceae bacterium]|nr:hypothetical protein [Pirellulaceae bacterium]